MKVDLEQQVKWALEDLKNIEELFKGNEKVIKNQRDLTEYIINLYLQEKRRT